MTRVLAFLAGVVAVVTAVGSGIGWLSEHVDETPLFLVAATVCIALIAMWWILALVGKGPFRFRIYAGTMTAIFLLTIPGGIVSSNLFLGFLYAGLALIPPAVEWFIRDSASRTRCPDCREEIRADANVCKHCGFRLRPRPKLGAYRAHR